MATKKSKSSNKSTKTKSTKSAAKTAERQNSRPSKPKRWKNQLKRKNPASADSLLANTKKKRVFSRSSKITNSTAHYLAKLLEPC